MFGFLKNLLRKPAATSAESQVWPNPDAEPAEPAVPEILAAQPPSPRVQPQRPVVRGQHISGAQIGARPEAVQPNGRTVELPLHAILAILPLELQARVAQEDVGDATVAVPLEKILSQLSRGTVKIPFGDLRQAAPDVFLPEADRDRIMVPLPLAEILSRLNPALITRRRVQKRIEVPAEVCSPFDSNGQSLIFSVGPAKAEAPPAPTPPPSRTQTPAPAAPAHAAPGHPAPGHAGPMRISITSAPTPQPPAALPPSAPIVIPPSRAMPETRPIPMPGAPAHAQQSAKPSAQPQPQPQPQPQHPQSQPLVISLTALADGWPDAIRKEIIQSNLVEAKVALPNEAVEKGLKQGRLAFTWKSLRSWLRPPASMASSAHDNAVVELPLKIVAPLFLERQREATKSQAKVAIDEEIPNLFFGFPQADSVNPENQASGATAGRAPETNYYIWDDGSDTARVDLSDEKRNPSPGTKFVARYATPNEVVSRAAALDGVAGALIALPDGLMVASRVSADLNGDTLAAFLPQIFGKVTQCTKELRMGELNNLNFTVGNVPWKIFRVNAIFFAAFGRSGEGLPTAQLAALAAELDHKPK
jgi:predicted regulator of Ras-like GTPase activity (Roadblock/LC7/MglB family)